MDFGANFRELLFQQSGMGLCGSEIKIRLLLRGPKAMNNIPTMYKSQMFSFRLLPVSVNSTRDSQLSSKAPVVRCVYTII